MDYCEGGDLFKRINTQKGILFPEEKVRTFRLSNGHIHVSTLKCYFIQLAHDRSYFSHNLKHYVYCYNSKYKVEPLNSDSVLRDAYSLAIAPFLTPLLMTMPHLMFCAHFCLGT